VLLGTGGANSGGYLMNKHEIVAADAAILFMIALLNSLPIQYVDYLGLFSANLEFSWYSQLLAMTVSNVHRSAANNSFNYSFLIK
jgi:hypothetical protein